MRAAGRGPVFARGQRPLHPHHARRRPGRVRLRAAAQRRASIRRWCRRCPRTPRRARKVTLAGRLAAHRRAPGRGRRRHAVTGSRSARPGRPTEATLTQVLIMLAVGLPIAVGVAVAGGFVLVRRALAPVERIAAQGRGDHPAQPERAAAGGAQRRRARAPVGVAQSHDQPPRGGHPRLQAVRRRRLARAAHAAHRHARRAGEPGAGRAARAPRRARRSAACSRRSSAWREIVEGLFALSRLDAGEAHAEWVRFDLAELAATTADQMSLLAEDKQVSVACDSAAGVTVEGDRARLKQVVVNLLDNAIKYTPRGGRVALQRRGARAATRCSTSPTTASAFPPRRCRTCSSASSAWMARARASGAAPASACRSSSRSARRTAPRSR